jgi:hypothetical protein
VTTLQIQHAFPHTCAGYGCAVCWWVDGRQAEHVAKKNAVLARLEHVTRWDRNRQQVRHGRP